MGLRARHSWYMNGIQHQCANCGIIADSAEQLRNLDNTPCYFPEHSIQELQTLSRMPGIYEAKEAYDRWIENAKQFNAKH